MKLLSDNAIIILLLVSIFISCNKHELEKPFAEIETSVLEIDESGITASATVSYFPTNTPLIDYGFIIDDGRPLEYIPDFYFDGLKFSLGRDLNGNEFMGRIERGMIKGQQYNVRGFIQSEDWVVYGTPIQFMSQGSIGISFDGIFPNDTIVPGDTLSIIGKYFGNIKQNFSIKIDNNDLPIRTINDELISVQIPQFIKDGATLSITNNFNSQRTNFAIPYIPIPQITSAYPTEVMDGDTMVIMGKYFSKVGEWNRIESPLNSNGSKLSIIYSDEKEIHLKFNVIRPAGGGSTLRVGVGLKTSERLPFRYSPIEIHDFFPQEGTDGDTITIIGKNPFTTPEWYFVGLENQTFGWEVIESSTSQLKAIIGNIYLSEGETFAREKIRVSANGVGAVSEQFFTYYK